MLGSLLIPSNAMSAAGIAPEELKPNCPKDVINMNVRLCCPVAKALKTRISIKTGERHSILQQMAWISN